MEKLQPKKQEEQHSLQLFSLCHSELVSIDGGSKTALLPEEIIVTDCFPAIPSLPETSPGGPFLPYPF